MRWIYEKYGKLDIDVGYMSWFCIIGYRCWIYESSLHISNFLTSVSSLLELAPRDRSGEPAPASSLRRTRSSELAPESWLQGACSGELAPASPLRRDRRTRPRSHTPELVRARTRLHLSLNGPGVRRRMLEAHHGRRIMVMHSLGGLPTAPTQ